MTKSSARKSSEPDWSALTWDDLEELFGDRTLARGRSYQRGGRVQKLCKSADGELLATVNGTESYATTVSLRCEKGKPVFESDCTCPIGGHCKHVVAVIAEYLKALADARDVPEASDTDPRWAKLENEGGEGGWDEGEDWEEDDYGDEEEDFEPAPRSRRGAGKGRATGTTDKQIEDDIRARSREELADLVCSLVRRFPELRKEFSERISLQKGDVKQLTAEARQQIRDATAEPGWSRHWSGEGYTPDFTPIRHRLERMLELGHVDEVVTLGRELIDRGLELIAQSDDEGETSEAFRECLPVVFQALARSSLSGPEKLLFVIDAMLEDDFDTFYEVSDPVLDAGSPKDWSAVADTLAGRLKDTPADTQLGDFSRNYRRDSLTNWLATALAEAGREEELGALYEREARATGSYERLVNFLLEQKRTDDAERWAREGIAATRAKLPGIASHLTEKLTEVARRRKQWDVIAAHAADKFFDRPDTSTFNELLKAARKAKVEDAVRDAALKYLETGTMPYRVREAKPAAAKRPVGKSAKKVANTEPPAPEEPPLVIDSDWPLPVPDYLRPSDKPRNPYNPGPRPHLDVLLRLAIEAKQPDEVLRWYDALRAAKKTSPYDYGYTPAAHYTNDVAEAVAETHPERALEIYRAGLDAQLPHADPTSYSAAAGYLRKMRPVYEALHRLDEWTELVADIREKYKRRPLFMEQLDGIEGRTIVESARKSRKG